jgi:hypothetical protein
MSLEGNSGISGALGYATETEWGVSKAPGKWTEILQGETLQRQQTYQRSAGIKAGRTFATGTRTVATTHGAGGNLPLEVPNKGFGAFLNLLHGEKVEGETLFKKTLTETYTQIHKIGTTDPFNKSLTLVKAAPKVGGGVVDSYCYPGAIFDSITFDMAISGFLTAQCAVQAKDENSEQSIGTVSYPSSPENFNFTQTILKVNSVEQKFAKSIKATFSKPTDGGRFALGSATRLQPLTNAFSSIKLDLEVDYTDQTLYEFFKKGEAKSVEISFVGNKMPTDVTKFELKFVFPFARFEGDSPNIKDLGPLTQTIPLMVEDNTSEAPCTATYVSSDSAL